MGLFNKKELAEIIKLKEENHQLYNKVKNLEKLNKENTYLKKKITETEQKYQNYVKEESRKRAIGKENSVKKRIEEEARKQDDINAKESWINQFYQNLNKYYKRRKTIFYRNEQGIYYCLEQIFREKTQWDSKKYIIVPQIRIADFIQPLDHDVLIKSERLEEELYGRYVRGEVTSKHVDFLICEHIFKGRDTEYKPVLVIEVHGKNHLEMDNVKRNDEFKKMLFNAHGIKLLVLEHYNQIENLKNYKEELEQKIKNVLLTKVPV